MRSPPENFGGTTTGEQVNTSGRAAVDCLTDQSAALQMRRARRRRLARLHRFVEPQPRDGDQRVARVDQRPASALGDRHARLLHQALERAARPAAHRAQPLPAAASPDGECGGECLEVERPALVGLQRQASAVPGQDAAAPSAPRPADFRQRGRTGRGARAAAGPGRGAERQQIRLAQHHGSRPADAGPGVGARREHRAGDLLEPACRRRPVPGSRHPVAQRVAAPLGGERAQHLRRQPGAEGRAGDIGATELVEETLRLGGVACGARHGRCGGRPALADRRQHARAQVVAIEAKLGVHGVLEPFEAPGAQVCEELLPRPREQRAHEEAACQRRPRGHGGDAGETCAAQQLQQHGLELIVLVMRREERLAVAQRLTEPPVAHGARGGFERFAGERSHGRAQHRERHGECAGHAGAVRAPAPRVRMQPVIDVDGAQLEGRARERGERAEQRRRVRTAAEGDAHGDLREVRQELRQARTQCAWPECDAPPTARSPHGIRPRFRQTRRRRRSWRRAQRAAARPGSPRARSDSGRRPP